MNGERERFQCRLCPRWFSKPNALKTHQAQHRGEGCPKCGTDWPPFFLVSKGCPTCAAIEAERVQLAVDRADARSRKLAVG